MSGVSFLDSNILVYTDDHDAPEKQAIALALVEASQANRDAFVSTQTLEEYFSAATRKLKVPASTALKGRALRTTSGRADHRR